MGKRRSICVTAATPQRSIIDAGIVTVSIENWISRNDSRKGSKMKEMKNE